MDYIYVAIFGFCIGLSIPIIFNRLVERELTKLGIRKVAAFPQITKTGPLNNAQIAAATAQIQTATPSV
jgi:hypothetical protein